MVVTPWSLIDPTSNQLPEEGGIPGWDYERNLELRRQITVNIDDTLRYCGLTGATLQIVVYSLTGPTALREKVWSSSPLDAGNETLMVSISPDSARLHQSVTLQTSLILSDPGSSVHVLAPSVPGSRLWQEDVRIILEGSLGRFPMEAVSFSELFPDSPKALWRLSWLSQYDESITNLRLLLNSDRTDLTDQLTSSVVIDSMMTDVILQMTVPVLSDSDLMAEIEDADPGTIGYMVLSWLQLLEEDSRRESLMQMARHSIGELVMRIQSRISVT